MDGGYQCAPAKKIKLAGDLTEGHGVPSGNDDAVVEKDVGITEYISKHAGFQGVIKQRYSDFLVNEIRKDGSVVRLTSYEAPPDEKQETSNHTEFLSPDDILALANLTESSDPKKKIIIELQDHDKLHRTGVHEGIRHLFPSLESLTEEAGEVKCISVTRKKQHGKVRTKWPKGRGNFCRFVMYKENKDTAEGINYIAKLSRINAKSFAFAGTKDKRAKTAQDVTVYRTEASKLLALNDRLKGVTIGNICYVDSALTLGDLKGNHFGIILRNMTGEPGQVQEALTSLKETGFINYYGMQRFGTTSIPSHSVGKALLHGDWLKAIDLILAPRKGDLDDLRNCRKVYRETKDAKHALRVLQRSSCVERHLLDGLVKCGNKDLVGALSMIPRNSRLMYVHSYQSYVWNTVVSRRIETFGLQPVPGDLVISSRDTTDTDLSYKVVPHVLTCEDVSQYTGHDIVLPLPGYEIMLPTNKVAGWYKEILEKDALTMEQLKHKVKGYSLPGAYRRMIVQPSDVTWETLAYNDVTEPLILSDYDYLQGQDIKVTEDGKYNALKLTFSLPSSTYATMAIREILKSDTSAAHQSTLNVT